MSEKKDEYDIKNINLIEKLDFRIKHSDIVSFPESKIQPEVREALKRGRIKGLEKAKSDVVGALKEFRKWVLERALEGELLFPKRDVLAKFDELFGGEK